MASRRGWIAMLRTHMVRCMVLNTSFARLAARPVDRVHIAASQVPTRDELQAIEGFEVSLADAAFCASFLARDGMTWDELRLPLRYAPEERIRDRLTASVEAGTITLEDDFIAYTPAGSAAARAVLDTRATALQKMWSNASHAVSELVELAGPVADAATQSAKPTSAIVDAALQASVDTDASVLWRSVAKIRRYRADCHAEAWAEAGHTIDSIKALSQEAPDRAPIEERTNELNADIWSHLSEQDQMRFMANLAALDGSGTPM